MELVHDFTVKAPIDEAWATLTDVERIAPCLPGAQLQEIHDDVYKGVVKVKVGPITAQFKGQATFVEKDDEHHRAVLKAEGRDTTGKGNASAHITAQLTPVSDTETNVKVTTDLTITGKVAQFGRGALTDVSEKLLNQFVTNLETTVLTGPAGGAVAGAAAGAVAADALATSTTEALPAPAPEATAAPAPTSAASAAGVAASGPVVSSNGDTASSGPRVIESTEVEPIDLLGTAGAPMLKRLLPILGGSLLLFIAWRLLRRR